jgi:hypothetical protein
MTERMFQGSPRRDDKPVCATECNSNLQSPEQPSSKGWESPLKRGPA